MLLREMTAVTDKSAGVDVAECFACGDASFAVQISLGSSERRIRKTKWLVDFLPPDSSTTNRILDGIESSVDVGLSNLSPLWDIFSSM